MADKSKWINLFAKFLGCFNFFFFTFTSNFIDFYGRKIKPMLPSMNIRNGAQIQDERRNVFIVLIQYGSFFAQKFMIFW
jgi:hypothetical protein